MLDVDVVELTAHRLECILVDDLDALALRAGLELDHVELRGLEVVVVGAKGHEIVVVPSSDAADLLVNAERDQRPQVLERVLALCERVLPVFLFGGAVVDVLSKQF